jgi:hypothetical protein
MLVSQISGKVDNYEFLMIEKHSFVCLELLHYNFLNTVVKSEIEFSFGWIRR